MVLAEAPTTPSGEGHNAAPAEPPTRRRNERQFSAALSGMQPHSLASR